MWTFPFDIPFGHYLWTFAFYLLLGEDSYPCKVVSDELKTCTHLNFYGDLQQGGTRIFLVSYGLPVVPIEERDGGLVGLMTQIDWLKYCGQG